jgi:CarD family transcriptional regulator
MAQSKKVPVKSKQTKTKKTGTRTIGATKTAERSKIGAKASETSQAAVRPKTAAAKATPAIKASHKTEHTTRKPEPKHAEAKPAAIKPAAKVTREAAVHPAAVAAAGRPAAPQRAVTAAMSKPAQPKISSPVTPKDLAVKAAEARQSGQAAKKAVSQRHGFKTNEFIVYPAHGVGRIVGIEEQEIAGMSLELFVITFDKDKMTLRVPTGKLQSVGMRKLADEDVVKKAMETLKGRARIKRTMWSRRAQEYEAKINSGDLVSIAEVVRDLYRSESQPEQSYSERQLYEAALDRMAREIAAVERLDERGAVQRITDVLSKSARGRRLAAEEGAEPGDDAEVQAA